MAEMNAKDKVIQAARNLEHLSSCRCTAWDCPDCDGTGEMEEAPSFQNAWGEHGLKDEPCWCLNVTAEEFRKTLAGE